MGLMKYLVKYFMRVYKVDPSHYDEIMHTATFAYEHIYIRQASAVRISTLYLLSRRYGVDLAKLMPRYPRQRAHYSILFARMLAARRRWKKNLYDDVDKFLHAYAYALYLSSRRALSDEVLYKAKDILWLVRHRIKDDPLAHASFALHAAMNPTSLTLHAAKNPTPVSPSQPCSRKVKVKTPSGQELELVPRRVWKITFQLGLFVDPLSGKEFRTGIPSDYPTCP